MAADPAIVQTEDPLLRKLAVSIISGYSISTGTISRPEHHKHPMRTAGLGRMTRSFGEGLSGGGGFLIFARYLIEVA